VEESGTRTGTHASGARWTQGGGQPLLKWAGGKRKLLSNILPLLPDRSGRYFEPFLGGGAVFFAYRPAEAVLSDLNPELINCYRQIKRRPHAVIDGLRAFKNNERTYYKIRAWVPNNNLDRAVRLIYLTSLSFNGIYRQNLSGVFNVPYGYKTSFNIHNPDRILSASTVLQSAFLRCGDFEESTKDARRGDVIYLDPPYTVAHSNNGFVKYNARIFSWEDQERLARVARGLAQRGCVVVVSNADHPSIISLYSEFRLVRVARASVISAASSYRKQITECLFCGS